MTLLIVARCWLLVRILGSGSSREHAAWAIAGYGSGVVISSFLLIFLKIML